jgi:transcriptional regulator with XRE-family HTH domain
VTRAEAVLVWNGRVERPRSANIRSDMTPGELLREVRRRHGLTQAQLAARARTSQAAISRIERDAVSPSVAMLERLLDLMGEELELDATRIDYGHDRTLNELNLRFTPEQRIARQASWARGIRELQRGIRG